MNADELSRRALDAAIARHVFDLEVEERTNKRTQERDCVCREPGQQWLVVSYYSSSLAASIKVDVELQKRGWKRIRPQGRETGAVRVILEHADGRTVEGFGPVNEAVCRAGLKAVQP